jgi:uncharacterized membrane protein YedE/YeeE
MSKRYANPYLAGVALGLVLLSCFVMSGQGLGASGAFAAAGSRVVDALVPQLAADNSYFQGYLQAEAAWMGAVVAGVIIGGALSAALNRRFHFEIVRGARISGVQRLLVAGAGGLLLGVGAVLARGCTSGQALSGGALLSVGSWAFMVAVFVAGYVAMPFFRRLWL